MTAHARTGGQILVDQLIVHGVDHLFCVPGESYLAALDALHDAAIAVTVCRQEGGAAMMADAYGKLTGRPGICFTTRGPGSTNASPGHPHRPAGFDAADHVRRPSRARHARARGFPGARLPRRVRHHRRNGRPRSTTRRACRSSSRGAFHVATAGRPGPVVIALPEDMLTETASVADAPPYEPIETHPALGQMAELQKLLWAAERPVAVLGGSRWSAAAVGALRALRRALRAAGVLLLPPADAVPGRSPVLRRRPRHRAEPEAAGAHQGGRPHPPGRRAAVRDAGAELHAARHPGAEADAGPCPPGPAGARPRLSPASRRQRLADRVLGGARSACSRPPPSGAASARGDAHADYLAWSDPAAVQHPGALQMGAVMAHLRATLPRRRDPVQRRRQLCDLGASLLAASAPTAPSSRRPPARWATACPPPSRRSACYPDRTVVRLRGRRRLPDERAGVRHRGAIRPADPRRRCSTTACTAPSACTRSGITLAASRRPPLRNPDFAAYARAFGGHGERVERTEEFAPALERARASGKPAILHCLLDPEAITPATTLTAIREKALASRVAAGA